MDAQVQDGLLVIIVICFVVAGSLWLFVSRAWLAAGGAAERFADHPTFTDAERRAIFELAFLGQHLRRHSEIPPPATQEGVAQLAREIGEGESALAGVAGIFASPGAAGSASLPWRAKLEGWRRRRWIHHEIKRLKGTLQRLRNGPLHRGHLNIADPASATMTLEKALGLAGGIRNFDTRPSIQVVEGIAYVEGDAPPNTVTRVRKVTARSGKNATITTAPRDEADVNRDYVVVVATYARALIDAAFKAVPGLRAVGVNLYLGMVHPLRGHTYRGCVLSVLADRETWQSIVHSNVSAENALRNFGQALRHDRRFKLLEVAPLPVPGQVAEGPTALSAYDLDPLEFEGLIQRLLQAMGYTATLTKASHDGGIDVEAADLRPVVGAGKVIVQCKRYNGSIGAPILRDLYGAVTDARASKGILITTSDFSPDAVRFAQDKPLELVNGRLLADLIAQYRVPLRG